MRDPDHPPDRGRDRRHRRRQPHLSRPSRSGRLDHHASSSRSAPTCRRRPTTSAPRSSRPAPILPRDIDPPRVTRVEFDSAADPHLRRRRAEHVGRPSCPGSSTTPSRARCRPRRASPRSRRVGGVNREINVILDPDRMAARGVTAPQVNNALRGFYADDPGGRADDRRPRADRARPGRRRQHVGALREMTIPTGRRLRAPDRRRRGRRRLGESPRLRPPERPPGRRLPGHRRPATASDVAVEDARAGGDRASWRRQHKDVTLHQDLLHGRRDPRQLRRHPARAARGHDAGRAGGACCSCATGARP